MTWKVTKADLELQIKLLTVEFDELQEDKEAVEGRLDDLAGKYANITLDHQALRVQCSHAERQVVRLLNRLEQWVKG